MLNYGFLMINFRKSPQNLPLNTDSFEHGFCEYGGGVEHLGRCELNTLVAVN